MKSRQQSALATHNKPDEMFGIKIFMRILSLVRRRQYGLGTKHVCYMIPSGMGDEFLALHKHDIILRLAGKTANTKTYLFTKYYAIK